MACRLRFVCAVLPEGDGAGRSDVEGVDAGRHGDFDDVVAAADCLFGQARVLRAEEEGQPLPALQPGIAEGQAVVPQGEPRRGKAEAAQQGQGFARRRAGVRDGEDGAHAHAHGAAVQRVAAVGGEQDGVHAQGRGVAEDRAHVGGFRDAFQHGGQARTLQHVLRPPHLRAAQRAQHPGALQPEARDGGEHVVVRGVDGDIAAAPDDVGAEAVQKLPAHQQRERGEPRIQRGVHDFRALGDEDALLGLLPAAQLGVGQVIKEPVLRAGQRLDFNDGHGFNPLFLCMLGHKSIYNPNKNNLRDHTFFVHDWLHR